MLAIRSACRLLPVFLSTSALIRLASMENALPPTRPAAMHAATTRSNMLRNAWLSRNRSFRAREKGEWFGIVSSMPSLKNQR